MTFLSDKEIELIGTGLVGRTLPKSGWTHAAHFAAAFWLLKHKDHDAFAEMPDFIRRYNTSVGTPNTDSDGYHETITLASLRAALSVLETATKTEALYETVNRFLASAYGNPDWILEYWTKELLFSAGARRNWIAPDIKALPF